MKTGIKKQHNNAPIIAESLMSVASSTIEYEEKFQPVVDYIEELEGKIRVFQKHFFDSKSEKRQVPENDPQMLLFNEAESSVHESLPTEEVEDVPPDSPAPRKRKPVRRHFSEHLPAVDVIHDIDESEKICGCGACLEKIGEEISEKVDIKPAELKVIRHIRYKYACKNCEGVEGDGKTVKIAPVPPQIIPKGIPAASLLAWIAASKFADHLPLYRQAKIFTRFGVEMSRSSMASWMIQAAEKCQPLIDLIRMEILAGICVNVDETTLQVLGEPDKSNTSKSYMWVFKGGDPEKPSVIYQYSPSRSGSLPLEFLEGYSGYVQTDGYSGYNRLESDDTNIRLLGCFAHVRRYFIKIIDARPKSIKAKPGSAEVALEYIRKLYAIEKQTEGLNPFEIYELRQKKAKPVLEEFNDWLNKRSAQVAPKSLLGQAIHYTTSNWNRLARYIENGNLKPDNNAAENAIRPFVVGRKNWLFSGHPNGANASASLFSIIESAKAAGLEPYAYLRYLFEKIPFAKCSDDYEALMPRRIDSKTIQSFIDNL